MSKQTITMAKASRGEINAMRAFFDQLEEKLDQGDDVEAWLYEQYPLSFSVERILFGFETLIQNTCDPAKDYLDWKPEIKALFEREKQLIDLIRWLCSCVISMNDKRFEILLLTEFPAIWGLRTQNALRTIAGQPHAEENLQAALEYLTALPLPSAVDSQPNVQKGEHIQ